MDTALDTLRRFVVSVDIDQDDILNDPRKIEMSLSRKMPKKQNNQKLQISWKCSKVKVNLYFNCNYC